ncbi:MAG: SIMPL domain-containing protein [Alphaproteobacteria bacterium]|nr:SIMPL domain-containing protein [Alphaproteobacteria bacterium]
MIKRIVGAAIISVGLVGFGYFRTYYLQKTTNFVTVKGLSEKIVRSDVAEMSLGFSNDKFENLEDLYKKRIADKEKVLKFIKDHGVADGEIVNFSMDTYDYTEETEDKLKSGIISTKKKRYFRSKDEFSLKTKDLEKVDVVKADVMKLFSENVFVSFDYNYRLTNFIDIKLGMMKEASANARKNAEVFVEPQGLKIGDVVYLNQGEVTIRAEDESEDVDYWNSKKDKSINKKLRLVVRAGFTKKKP